MTYRDIMYQYFGAVVVILSIGTALEMFVSWKFVFLSLALLAGNLVGVLIRIHYREKSNARDIQAKAAAGPR